MKTETFSYLPALSKEQVTRQVQYFLDRGWIPGVEYTAEIGPTNDYWSWWKLPLFSAETPAEVLAEIEACKAANPGCYIKVTGYDSARQGQVMSFVVEHPE